MYLSKLALNLRHPGARQCLRNCQDMHRSLLSAFQDCGVGRTRAQVGMLYHLSQEASPTLWLSSLAKPNCKTLAQKGFSVAGIKDVSGLQQTLKAGTLLRFRLLAVPCKKVQGEGKNSKRRYLKQEEERSSWLARKAEQNGFYVHQSMECGERSIAGRKGEQALVLTAMEWTGVLEVTDTALFWKAFCEGLGAERAYGAGMLMLSRL